MGVMRIIFSAVCSFLGISSFIAFIILKNNSAAVLGFVSGSTDAILVFLHYLEHKRKLLAWYDKTDLRRFCRLGIIIGSIGLLSGSYFAIIQIMQHKPMMPIPESATIPLVWSLVVLRSGLLLMYYCIKYQEENINDTQVLLDSNEEVQQT